MVNVLSPCTWNHELCIVDEVMKLTNRGFTCYVEHAIYLQQGTQKRIVVDIYARKEDQEVIIEVGTLYERWVEGRLNFLKKLFPKAKIIHVHQWKNYGINGYVIWAAGMDWRRQIETWGMIMDEDLGQGWGFSGCFKDKENHSIMTAKESEIMFRMGESLAKK